MYESPLRRKAFLASLFAYGTLPAIARASGGLDIGQSAPPAHTMRVLLAMQTAEQPRRLDAWYFSWRGRSYRGDFTLVPLDDRGRTGLINTLSLDAYLYGVVSKEISESWSSGAQQAQAIAARTYALQRQCPDRPYDILVGQSAQSYGGIEAETIEGRAAVDETAGTIVTFNRAPADIAYSACCGGHTESAADLWGTQVPYLRGIPDPNCIGAPGFEWQQRIPQAMLCRMPGAREASLGRVCNVELRDIDASGRPRRIALIGERGTLEIKSDGFRSLVGPSLVRSTLIHAARIRAGDLFLEGRGFGHGVGLCQWGMRGLAKRGVGAGALLQFYFPGTSLGQA